MLKEGLRRLSILLRIGAVCWTVGIGGVVALNTPMKFIEPAPTSKEPTGESKPFDPDAYLNETSKKREVISEVASPIPPGQIRDYSSWFRPATLAITFLPGIIIFALAWLIDGFSGNYRRKPSS